MSMQTNYSKLIEQLLFFCAIHNQRGDRDQVLISVVKLRCNEPITELRLHSTHRLVSVVTPPEFDRVHHASIVVEYDRSPLGLD